MALAQRLNELAIANSEGLLNDDEYRLLRQSVFEQYSGNAGESSLVPGNIHHSVTSTTATPKEYTTRLPVSELIIDQHHKPLFDQHKPASSHAKPSAASGMVDLMRKATGRKSSSRVHENTLANNPHRAGNLHFLVNKRSPLVPRLLHKKLAELPPLLTNTSGTRLEPSHPVHNTCSKHAHLLPSPSHTGSARHIIPPHHSIRETDISTVPDVFDDDNLTTGKEIRAAITTCEDEARKLVDAFNDLEASALRRHHKRNARGLPVTTHNVNLLLEGREWREHRLNPSHSSPMFDYKERHLLNSTDSTGDGMSIHSGSSQTSLTQAKSISSLPKYPPGSPLSPYFHTTPISPARKNSISSISSPRTSFTSTRVLAVTPSSTLSRSTSHLALPKLKGNADGASAETIGGDHASEISDIRQRREDLVARYTARLEFLRAKLKGAELHEKVLRK